MAAMKTEGSVLGAASDESTLLESCFAGSVVRRLTVYQATDEKDYVLLEALLERLKTESVSYQNSFLAIYDVIMSTEDLIDWVDAAMDENPLESLTQFLRTWKEFFFSLVEESPSLTTQWNACMKKHEKDSLVHQPSTTPTVWTSIESQTEETMGAEMETKYLLKTTFRNAFTEVKVETQRYGTKAYKDVFSGRELVDWMVARSRCRSRKDALIVCQEMMNRFWFHHCLDRHAFHDDAIFYRLSGSGNQILSHQSENDDGSDSKKWRETIYQLFLKMCSVGTGGVMVKDRRYSAVLYKNVFLGTEAWSWLKDETRSDPVVIGNRMIQLDLIKHVVGEHAFRNKKYFYTPTQNGMEILRLKKVTELSLAEINLLLEQDQARAESPTFSETLKFKRRMSSVVQPNGLESSDSSEKSGKKHSRNWEISGSLASFKRNMASMSMRKKQSFGVSRSNEQWTLKQVNLIKLHPLNLAEAITHRDYKILQVIPLHELSGARWKKDGGKASPMVTKLISTGNELGRFVLTEIFTYPDKETQAKLITIFVQTAEYLKNLSNFNSLVAILNALNSPSLSRVASLWKLVDGAVIEKMEALTNSLTGPDYRFKPYRKLLVSLRPPVIPYLGVALEDMYKVEIGEETKNSNGMINWLKMKNYAALKIQFVHLRAGRLTYNSHGVIQEYLNNALVLSEEQIYKLSQKLRTIYKSESGSSSSASRSSGKG